MRLAELDPKLEGTLASGVLRFRCPLHPHSIRLPLGPGGWAADGVFPDNVTVTPSVDCHCSPDHPQNSWHGHIVNSEVS